MIKVRSVHHFISTNYFYVLVLCETVANGVPFSRHQHTQEATHELGEGLRNTHPGWDTLGWDRVVDLTILDERVHQTRTAAMVTTTTGIRKTVRQANRKNIYEQFGKYKTCSTRVG